MAQRIEDRIGFSGKPWPQYPVEIDGFIGLIVEEGISSYMEVGCRYGDTFHAVGMALPKISRLIAVDLPGAKSGMRNKGGHQDSGTYLQLAADDLNAHGQQAHVILGDSHERATIDQAAAFAPVDMLLIDGDHTAEGVRADLANFAPMARIVAFHDIAGEGKWSRQIRPIYHAIRQGKRWQEFIFDGKRRGIGVVWQN